MAGYAAPRRREYYGVIENFMRDAFWLPLRAATPPRYCRTKEHLRYLAWLAARLPMALPRFLFR